MEFEFVEDEVTDRLAAAYNDLLGDDPDPPEPSVFLASNPAKAAEYDANRLDAIQNCLRLLARRIDLLTASVMFGPRFVGLTLEEAQANAALDGLTVRVVSRDGEGMTVKLDRRANRVNVDVESGVITAVRFVG